MASRRRVGGTLPRDGGRAKAGLELPASRSLRRDRDEVTQSPAIAQEVAAPAGGQLPVGVSTPSMSDTRPFRQGAPSFSSTPTWVRLSSSSRANLPTHIGAAPSAVDDMSPASRREACTHRAERSATTETAPPAPARRGSRRQGRNRRTARSQSAAPNPFAYSRRRRRSRAARGRGHSVPARR